MSFLVLHNLYSHYIIIKNHDLSSLYCNAVLELLILCHYLSLIAKGKIRMYMVTISTNYLHTQLE